jgi:hypothetical protein
LNVAEDRPERWRCSTHALPRPCRLRGSARRASMELAHRLLHGERARPRRMPHHASHLVRGSRCLHHARSAPTRPVAEQEPRRAHPRRRCAASRDRCAQDGIVIARSDRCLRWSRSSSEQPDFNARTSAP